MESTNEIIIVPFAKEHLSGLRNLYITVFGIKEPVQYFQNKFGLADPEFVDFSKVALHRGEVIGFMGANMLPFTNGEEEINTISFCDFILFKEYRKKGILELLYNALLQDYRINEIDVLYSIQSDQTHKVSQRWNWTDFNRFSRFHIYGSNKYISGISRKILSPENIFKRFKKLSLNYHTSIDFNAAANNKNGYWHNYKSAYFNSKQDHFHLGLIIAGCQLYVSYHHHLTVGYIKFQKDADIKSMVTILEVLLRKSFIHEAVIHVQSNLDEIHIFKSQLKEELSYKVSGTWLRSSPNQSINLNFMDMNTF